jgi:hypothetical protein
MFPDFCQCHSGLPVIYLMEWRHRKGVKRARLERNLKDDVSWLFHLYTVLPVFYYTDWRQKKDVWSKKVKQLIIRLMIPVFRQCHSVLPVIYFMELRRKSWEWCFLTSFICIKFYLLFILRDESRERMWSEKAKKVIIRMMIPVFCHFHPVLPVIYLMEWMQRKDVKRAREKIDHKDDVSWLLLMSLRSTCYLFNGMEAEEGREASKREKRS